MKNSNVAIEVKHIKKSYKNLEVLKDVTFSVEKGTIFALLGANGAGKTTVINILTTLLKADGGTATVYGFDTVTQPKDVRSHISLTGQFAAVDDILTARENLELIADLRHVRDSDSTVNKLLEQFNLVEAADRRLATFSGGMSRRVDIAMSLIGNPSIIFFDEPTTGLDPQSRNSMWKTIKSLAESGTTIFLTTQYLEEADQLADKIAILSEGKIVAQGTASELKELVSHGQVELKFNNEQELARAKKLLNDYEQTENYSMLTLSVATDGSVTQLAQLLSTLEGANIELVEFSQKAPSLDDVFLQVINENKEKTS